MKKVLLITLFFLVCIISVHAQTLYGTTLMGGSHDAGTINKLTVSTNNFSVVFSAQGIDGRNPQYTSFVQANNGKLYGMTILGGAYDGGIIFSYDPATAIYTKLKDLDSAGGRYPRGSLVQANDGKLYGMTSEGGTKNMGVIFSFDPATLAYAKLMDFDYEKNTGGGAIGDLVQGNNGKLYGMTSTGGQLYDEDEGVLFSFDPSTLVYKQLHYFSGDGNGARPKGSLVQASNGKWYGMASTSYTQWPWGEGILFSYDEATNTFTKIYDFDTNPGANPVGSLVQASDGKLYGRAQIQEDSQADFIFSLDPNTNVFTIIKNVTGYSTGRMVQAGDGKLYGMSSAVLGTSHAEIFSFDPATSDYAVVYNFERLHYGHDGPDASRPLGSLIQASDGKLYGMNTDGGGSFYNRYSGEMQGAGLIFSFDPTSSVYTTLKDFGANETGSNFSGAPLLANDGKMYGMALTGGAKGLGAIYSWDTLTSTFAKLKDFNGTDGAYPYGSLIQASDGKLYGMTSAGGAELGGRGSYVVGVLFSYDPLSSVYKVLWEFSRGEGRRPFGSLVEAANGKLYGMTSEGGRNGTGVIFSYDPSSSSYKVIKELFPGNGIYPYGTLFAANDGKLYGTASSGEPGTFGPGTIFSIDPVTSTFTRIKRLAGYTYSSLIQASDGKLYGTVEYSPTAGRGAGAIFSLDPVSTVYTELAGFDANDRNMGVSPRGTLLQASNGLLYGFTMNGGSNELGIVYSFDIGTSKISKLLDLNGSNGAKAGWGAGFIELPECTTNTAYYKDADGDGFGDPYKRKIALSKPTGYVSNNKDCDDKNKAIHPVTYYRDADGDSFGDANVSITLCGGAVPAGYAKNKNDDDDHQKLDYKIANYPNPFKGTSSIKYALPFDSKVSVKVYDPSGKPLATLVNENKKAGFYTADFNASGLSGGILYYKITADSKDQHFEQTNKMILLR